MIRAIVFLLALMLANALGGCQHYYRFARYTSDNRKHGQNVLLSHRSPLVFFFAALGDAAGSIASLPVAIPTGFVMGMVDGAHDQTDDEQTAGTINETEQKRYIRLAPLVVFRTFGQHALGGPAWLAFGWWWPKSDSSPTPQQAARSADVTAKKVEAPSVTATPLPPSPSGPDQPLMAMGGGYVGALAFSPDGRTCAIGRGKYLLLIDAGSGQCRQVLGGHKGMVAGAAFSADGTKVVSSSFDQRSADLPPAAPADRGRKLDFTARLWSAADGRCLQIFAGHTDSIVGLAISADGTRIVTGSDDRTARLWDAQSGQCLLTLSGHAQGVGTVAIAPNGATILTGSGDATARLWDATSGRCLQTLVGHKAPVYSVAFAPDGQRALTASPDRTACVWDVKTGKRLLTLNCGTLFGSRVKTSTDDFFGPLPPTNMVLTAAYTQDGRTILTGLSSGQTILWNAADGRRLRVAKTQVDSKTARRQNPGVCRAVVFSRDGARIMTGALDGLVRLWDTSTGQCLQTMGGHGDLEIESLALSPDGQTLATGSAYCTTCLWRIADGRCVKTLKFVDVGPGWPVSGVAFTHNGARVFTACHDGYFRIWQTSDGRQLSKYRGAGENGYRYAAASPDGQQVIVADGNQTAHLLDMAREKLLRSFAPEERQGGREMRVAISPDHAWALLAAPADAGSWLQLWDARSGRHIYSRETDAVTNDVCFSGDGKTFLSGWKGYKARLWRTSDGQCLREIGLQEPPKNSRSHITSLALSPDGKLAAMGLADGRLGLWRVEDGQCLRMFNGHQKEVTFLCFTPDGSQFVSAAKDKLILLWTANP